MDLSIVQGPFSVAPCQTLISRFATFPSRYQGHCAVFLGASEYALLLAGVAGCPLVLGGLLARLTGRFAAEGVVVGATAATMTVALVFGAATDGATLVRWSSSYTPYLSSYLTT